MSAARCSSSPTMSGRSAGDFGREQVARSLAGCCRKGAGFGEQRARIFREIAQITGAKSIAEGNEMQLNRLQISDLGLARKITVCKNHTVVEGNANLLPSFSFRRGLRNGQVLRLEMKKTLGAQLA